MKRSNLLFSLFVAALVFNTDLSAQRRGGGGNYGGGNRKVRSSTNSSVNRNYNQNTNVNRNVNVERTLTLSEGLTSITATTVATTVAAAVTIRSQPPRLSRPQQSSRPPSSVRLSTDHLQGVSLKSSTGSPTSSAAAPGINPKCRERRRPMSWSTRQDDSRLSPGLAESRRPSRK